MNSPQYVAQKLKEALQRHNITLTEFAAEFGIQWEKLQMLMAGNFASNHIR